MTVQMHSGATGIQRKYPRFALWGLYRQPEVPGTSPTQSPARLLNHNETENQSGSGIIGDRDSRSSDLRLLRASRFIRLSKVVPTGMRAAGPPISTRSRANTPQSGYWGKRVPFFTGVKPAYETLNCKRRPEDPPSSSIEEPIPFEHRLMTKRQLAEYFRITERTIEVWMRRRYIPYIKIGQSVRFRVASVLRYVDDKYMVPAGKPQRRRKDHGKPASLANIRPDAADGPSPHDPSCDASGTPSA
jgi:excisionase family DNA binding protein